VLSFLVFVVACCHAAMAADDFRDGSLAKKAQEDLKLSETQEAMMQAVKIKARDFHPLSLLLTYI
jgi:hypothetical protein